MIKIPDDLPVPPDKVFVLATPAHMLDKLHWEINRLKKCLIEPPERMAYMNAPAYYAFNIAVTAWHLTDWVWQTSSAERREEILKSLGAEMSSKIGTFSDFQNAIRAKSRAIHICRQIATGSKHMTVTKHPDPNVRAEMRWHVVSNELGEGYYQYALMIFDNNDERSALDVFEEAYKDWKRYLGEWWFIEGTLVAPNPKLVEGL